MDLYPWIVFLHVVGVLLFFIAHGTSMAVGFRLKRERDPARVRALLELTDRKSLLALRGVGPESEAESVRFHGRRVTKVGPEVKHGLFRVPGRVRNPKELPLEAFGPKNKRPSDLSKGDSSSRRNHGITSRSIVYRNDMFAGSPILLRD